MADGSLLARARADVGVFAEALIGEPLWPHQLDLARSTARTRVACCGRQSGKSRTLAVLGLHTAFVAPNRLVLVVSATDDAAKRLLAEVSVLASGPLLAGSVVDESKSRLVLSNGSQVVSVPASERQVRGYTADLLIVDEAAFVTDDVWRAARFTTVARGGRVVLASTPWGRRDRFFASAWSAARSGAAGFEGFSWPSTASPLVSEELLEEWRPTMTVREFRSEVLAEWVDDSGAYFSAALLDGMVDDGLVLVPPGGAGGQPASAGVDWGFAADSSTCVLLAEDGEGLWVPWVDEWVGRRYVEVVDAVAAVGEGYSLVAVGSEVNGVGAMPTQQLAERLGSVVVPVSTSAVLKQDAFGAVAALGESGRLRLPRHPGLLRQLAALEFETLDSGLVRIAVPERAGHDDLAMGLALAVWVSPGVPVGERGRRRRRVVRSSVVGGPRVEAAPPAEVPELDAVTARALARDEAGRAAGFDL